MKLKLDVCKTCDKFTRFENGKIGCSLLYDEKWTYTIGEEGLTEKYFGGFTAIGNIKFTLEHEINQYDEKTFESLNVDNKCELYAEYCMREWNKDEKEI